MSANGHVVPHPPPPPTANEANAAPNLWSLYDQLKNTINAAIRLGVPEGLVDTLVSDFYHMNNTTESASNKTLNANANTTIPSNGTENATAHEIPAANNPLDPYYSWHLWQQQQHPQQLEQAPRTSEPSKRRYFSDKQAKSQPQINLPSQKPMAKVRTNSNSDLNQNNSLPLVKASPSAAVHSIHLPKGNDATMQNNTLNNTSPGDDRNPPNAAFYFHNLAHLAPGLNLSNFHVPELHFQNLTDLTKSNPGDIHDLIHKFAPELHEQLTIDAHNHRRLSSASPTQNQPSAPMQPNTHSPPTSAKANTDKADNNGVKHVNHANHVNHVNHVAYVAPAYNPGYVVNISILHSMHGPQHSVI